MGGTWLDRGHGDGESLVQVTAVSAREIVDPSNRSSSTWNSRSTKAIVGALAAATLIGSAGTAYAIRETLFPTFGAPTAPSVWENPRPAEAPAAVTVASTSSSTSTTTSTVPPATAVPADTLPASASASATVTSVEDHAGKVDSQGAGSENSGRRGSVSTTVVPEIDDSGSETHATTTEPVAHSGASVPESGGATTTEAPGSGGGSSGSGSGADGGSDNSGSGRSGTDDDQIEDSSADDQPEADDEPKAEDRSKPDD